MQRARAVRHRAPWAVLALILALSAHLRLGATLGSEVIEPIRSDAAEHFWYAHNLRAFGVYSRRPPTDPPAVPEPDSLRPPGYPLLVAGLADGLPPEQVLKRVVVVQAWIGVAVTLFTFLLARPLLGPAWALLPTLLTAASPHLVNAGIYLLTETLFSLMVAGALLVLARRDLEHRLAWFALAGAVVGAAALVRATANYLPLALAALFFLHLPRPTALRAAALLFAGFALLFAPWAARNALLPGGADPQLKINMLHHGMYPDFTYEGVPDSYGYPYRADPRSAEIGGSMGAVTAEIVRRFREEPGRHLQWFLVGKPVALWSWNQVQAMGGAFGYNVSRSPYFESRLFEATEILMHAAHRVVVLLAAAFCVAVWLPRTRAVLPPGTALLAQACALVLLYVTALHMIGFPLPRYSVPFRPELYIAASTALFLLVRPLRARSAPAAATP